MSADVEALDGGVVDVGLLAAEALSRVDVLEAKVAALSHALAYCATEAGLYETAAMLKGSRRPDLTVVKP
jgi:hypothetical protein